MTIAVATEKKTLVEPRMGVSPAQYVIELNKTHAERFFTPAAREARAAWRDKYRVEIYATMCMDGRVNLTAACNTLPGIISPFRTIGGKIDMGWVGFQLMMQQSAEYALSKSRASLMLVSYHFSRSDAHLGCAGFSYNTEAACAHARHLKEQFDRTFCEAYGKDQFYAVQVGIETDVDALILHGADDAVVDLSEISDTSEAALMVMLQKLYPDMSPGLRTALLQLVKGNVEHSATIRALGRRPDESREHRERIIAIGRGFDWFKVPNIALIIGPFDPNLPNAIEKAANLVLSNLIAANIQGPILLMANAPYREQDDVSGLQKNLAIEKARFNMAYMIETLQARVPAIVLDAERLTTITNMDNRALEVLDFEPSPRLPETKL